VPRAGDGAHVALDATDTVSVTVGVADLARWCAVSSELDPMFSAAEATIEDGFVAVQVAYENIRRLLARSTTASTRSTRRLDRLFPSTSTTPRSSRPRSSKRTTRMPPFAAIMEAFGPEGVDYDSPGRAAVGAICEPDAEE
jgi:hypothetical protein